MKDDVTYYDREDFYSLDVFEKEYGSPICHCECHCVNVDIFDSLECCRNCGDRYLLNVDRKLYILRSYADRLLAEKAKQESKNYASFRRIHGIEWDYRTPRHIGVGNA